MLAKDYRDLFLLAAIWGSSFLFMHLSVDEFGPFALVEVRLGFSALFLLVVAGLRGRLAVIWRHAPHISVAGIFAAGLPFLSFNYAAQSVPASVMAVINAMTPLFGALIARLWLKERLTPARIAGLLLGFSGILVLVWKDLSFSAGGMGLGILACLSASLCYGYAACYTTRFLKGVDPLALAAGSVTAAALALLPFAAIAWPHEPISTSAWSAALALALLCTGLAYIIYYGLLDRVGATRSITVTFLVPLFGIFWGAVILDETLSPRMLAGTAIVLLGTLLATGLIGSRRTSPAAAKD
ncbi:MAG TPA: DMT family transporter [Burkholderiaceae bacterium]|jgi:drug/metabolite transporter (DMT)-like permease|nr:DMT family transporter [Burkholderiaceae bacterium]